MEILCKIANMHLEGLYFKNNKKYNCSGCPINNWGQGRVSIDKDGKLVINTCVDRFSGNVMTAPEARELTKGE